MSSILTNTSAMVALQNLKSIGTSLNQTTAEISTGKRVGSAKDNAAVWAISKVMESDVASFKGISDSLALGSSTIAVARQASEAVVTNLTSIKQKIVAAQESNVDRTKIQADIAALRQQINSVVGAAQFNGLNLVNGSQGNEVKILSSLDRAGIDVTASSISVAPQNLGTGGYVAKTVFNGTDGASAGLDTAASSIDAGATGTILIQDDAGLEAGDKISITIAGKSASYTVSADDIGVTTTDADVSEIATIGLKRAIESLGIEGLVLDYTVSNGLTITNNVERSDGGDPDANPPVAAVSSPVDISFSLQFQNAGAGGLTALNGIDVSTAAGAEAALGSIEDLMQTAIDASAAFGSAQSRVDTQKEFIGKLVDSMKAGIGSLVDADMEEASARLQALQVQQQLSTQALSIANQQPQALLSLFR
jgi:flagellin